MEEKKQKATLGQAVSKVRRYDSKELVSGYRLIGYKNKDFKELVDCRVYMGRSASASTVYCSLWVKGKEWTSASGQAGGYGYHKESAAIGEAISNANIKLAKSIHGVGNSAIEEALFVIGKALRFRKMHLVRFYG
jgi:hypothetical protein